MCKILGHYSTGSLLWYMCDRCHAIAPESVARGEWTDHKRYGTVRLTRWR